MSATTPLHRERRKRHLHHSKRYYCPNPTREDRDFVKSDFACGTAWAIYNSLFWLLRYSQVATAPPLSARTIPFPSRSRVVVPSPSRRPGSNGSRGESRGVIRSFRDDYSPRSNVDRRHPVDEKRLHSVDEAGPISPTSAWSPGHKGPQREAHIWHVHKERGSGSL